VVKDLFREFIKMDIRTDNPAELVSYKAVQKDTGYHKRFTREDDAIIDKHLKAKCPGLFLFRQFMLGTGRRRAEIVRIQVKRIMMDRNTIYMGKTKSGRPDIAMITNQLKEHIVQSGIMESNPEYYVFGQFTYLQPGPAGIMPGSITKKWKKYVKNPIKEGGLGIDKNLYGNKHTVATRLIKLGADPRLVKMFLGHADQETTTIYGQGIKEAEFKQLQPYFDLLQNAQE